MMRAVLIVVVTVLVATLAISTAVVLATALISISKGAEPPRCTGDVCPMYGPGGVIYDWKLHALAAAAAHKTLVVDPYKTCASACAIAVGVVLRVYGKVRISPTAVFIPHNIEAIKKARMEPAFKKLMLAYKPFHWVANP